MALEALLMPAVAVFVLVLLVWRISTIRDWQDYEIFQSSGTVTGRILERLWESPAAWMLGFVLLTAVALVAGILAVSRDELVSMPSGTLLMGTIGVIGGLMAAFLFFGTYFSIRSRGAKSSLAAALSSLLMGFVVLGVVTLRLAGIV